MLCALGSVLAMVGCTSPSPIESAPSSSSASGPAAQEVPAHFKAPKDGPFGDWRAFLNDYPETGSEGDPVAVELGPRPAALVASLPPGSLKRALASCTMEPKRTDFSIAHRGASRLFPEHTREAYIAAAQQGAGLIECDVTFTRDGALVCRHAQCDLHRTTNILETPLAERCRQSFQSASDGKPATVECCTSDLTLDEFLSLCGRHDDANRQATRAEEYQRGPTYADPERYPNCGTLMTLDASIALIESLGAGHVPELKVPEVPMPFDTDGDGVGDLTQTRYADALIDTYRRRGVDPTRLFPQSFRLDDVRHWITTYPDLADRVIWLDGRAAPLDPKDPVDPGSLGVGPTFTELRAEGLRIVAPPLWFMLRAEAGRIVPSSYAIDARRAGLDLIGWTIERSGSLLEDVKQHSDRAFFYRSTRSALTSEGDIFTTLEVLKRQVGVRGVFSDWPATTTYFDACGPVPPRPVKAGATAE
ncbi:MAG: glycerophosphodiester phosphodiesterase family protein [Pseudomonadota bacterium]